MIIPDRLEPCTLRSAVRRTGNRTGTDYLRISGLRTDALQAADLAGKSSDLLLRRVNSHTDDIDPLFAVGYPHPADDVLPVVVQYTVYAFGRLGVFNDYGDDSYSSRHDLSSFHPNIHNPYGTHKTVT